MRVLVTGGTGFVGSHTVDAIAGAGHDLRLLARSQDRVGPALEPLGVDVDDVEVVVGDATRAADVSAAVDGCDAVVHAAAVYSIDARRGEEMLRTNMRATELVLSAAAEAGLDPIVHVSSVAALLPSDEEQVTEDSPPGDTRLPYHRSKAESDRVARTFQERGAPVVITYPGAVFGPHDPHVGVSSAMLEEGLRTGVALSVKGAFFNVVDVRDVAAIHVATLEPGRGPRRFMASGWGTSHPDLWERIAELTGRRIRVLAMPATPTRAISRASDWLSRRLGVPSFAPYEGVWSLLEAPPGDHSRTVEELDVRFRPVSESVADTVRWLHEAGHITAEQAGTLAS